MNGITEHVVRSARHVTFYLASGPTDGPLVVFCHGWPELSVSWRHQLACLGALGFRAVAPDMRGYGRSQVHARHEDYAMEPIVADMRELLGALGRDAAVWVGHDWGTPVVWSLASHHPEQCLGVAGLCVPYQPEGFAVETSAALVNREIYPEDRFPVGQWDYQLYYREHFEDACRAFEADPVATVKTLFRHGEPQHVEQPARLASVRRNGGWFGPAQRAPDLPLDTKVLGEAELHQYASALARNGFFGPDSWYMNAERNIAYGRASVNEGRLAMPVLFLHAAFDPVCETLRSRLADPMRAACERLTERVVKCGHWMAQEQPLAVNAALAGWLARELPDRWPAP